MNRAPRQTRREKRDAAVQEQHVRDRFEVELTAGIEEALRKAGPHEPALVTKGGTQMYGVCLMSGAGQRWAALSTVPPLDDKETCPICGSLDFWKTTVPFNAWCPDPNRRACQRCAARWEICGNGLPLVDASNQTPLRSSEKGSVVVDCKPGRPKDPQDASPVEAVRQSSAVEVI